MSLRSVRGQKSCRALPCVPWAKNTGSWLPNPKFTDRGRINPPRRNRRGYTFGFAPLRVHSRFNSEVRRNPRLSAKSAEIGLEKIVRLPKTQFSASSAASCKIRCRNQSGFPIRAHPRHPRRIISSVLSVTSCKNKLPISPPFVARIPAGELGFYLRIHVAPEAREIIGHLDGTLIRREHFDLHRHATVAERKPAVHAV